MTLQERLDAAETQYHLLVTGQQARVVVDGNNGERVEYTPANAARLAAYIADLKRQLSSGCVGPMRVWL